MNAFADEVSKLGRLDGALLIAGVDGAPRASDGVDPHFRINYLSHALLARRLLPQLRKSRGRVVTVSSEALLDSDLSLSRLDEGLVAQRGASPHVRRPSGIDWRRTLEGARTGRARRWHTQTPKRAAYSSRTG